ncbi:MAG: hypothetical protein GXY88_05155 [Tissierellia bacterium]|nr:hypothetical protein [Tissierellia bacterium]
MRNLKFIFLFIVIITLSSCTQSGININDDILDEKQAEEMKINTDLVQFDDFELEKNSDWLIPLTLDEKPIRPENPDIIEHRETIELEKKLLEKMKQKKQDIVGMNLVLNKNNFLVFWNKNKGKIYLYDDEKESLQFLLDTDILEGSLEEAMQEGQSFFLADVNKEHLYLANGNYLYQFDHEGKQILSRKIPENFKILTLRESFAVLTKEEKLYIYSYSSDSITHVFENKYVFYYYKDYLILQKDNEMYCIDFRNNKMYYHQERNIGDMQPLIIPGSDKIIIIDKENLDGAPREYKINLPKL